MDPRPPERGDPPGEQISSLINEYFDRRQAGEDLTPRRFVAEHPEVADELQPYLAGLDLIEKARTGEGQGEAAGGELPAIDGYELLEEIGRGGMGVVYRALQTATKRVVALKVMLAGPFASPTSRQRFRREVQLEARLEHPNIVRVLGGGDAGGQPYYAMEYVPGLRLDRYLSTSHPDARATLQLCMQICEAAAYAHAQGVVHRDIKPSNVLVDDQGHPHILDFGLAKATDQSDVEAATGTFVSVAGQVVGTLPYLSPEQAAGKPEDIDVRTDVYALGVMLFEALTGTLPVDTSGRPSEVLERIVETPPPAPSSLSDRVDREIEAIILKALQKNRSARYQSAEGMADDIRRYLEGEPILAQPPSSFYLIRKRLHKYRFRVAAVVAVLVAVAVGLWVDARSRRRDLANARRAAVQQRMWEDRNPVVVLRNAKEFYARYPRLPEAVLILAQAEYMTETERASAILRLERLLKSDPSLWAPRALLADFYRRTGHTELADAMEAQVEREAPDTGEAWYLRSFATLDLREALACALEAVRHEPHDAIAWRRLTYLRLQAGNLDAALAGADTLIELGEDAGDLIFFKGQALATRGRFRDAIEQYSLLTTIWPKPTNAFLHRAHAYRRIQEHEKAVNDYDRVVAEDGEATDPWVFYQRATPLWILGRTDEALADYRRVRLRLGFPFYSDARRFLILSDLQRDREADLILEAALSDVQDRWLRQIFRCLAGQITPEALVADAVAHNNLEHLCEAYYYAGEVCLQSGRPGEATPWFEKCVQTGVEFDQDTQAATPMNEFELAIWRLHSLPEDTHSLIPEKN